MERNSKDMLNRIKAYVIKNKKVIIPIAVIVSLVIIILMIVCIDTSSNIDNNIDNNLLEEESFNDIEEIESIIKDISSQDYEIISNKNNEQADIILNMLGVDIKNIYSYALTGDIREESAYMLAIIRPKPEYADEVTNSFIQYISTKHTKLNSSTNENKDKYLNNLELAVIIDYKGYKILIVDDFPDNTIDIIRERLDKLDSTEDVDINIQDE